MAAGGPPSPRVRVHADDWLTLQIFHGIRDQAILPNYHDDVVGSEAVVGQEAPLQQLEAALTLEYAFGFQQLLHVDVVLAKVVRDVHMAVLQIELRLRPGVEALGQLLQARLAGHQDEAEVLGCAHLLLRLPEQPAEQVGGDVQFTDLAGILSERLEGHRHQLVWLHVGHGHCLQILHRQLRVGLQPS